jgi:FdrA protein
MVDYALRIHRSTYLDSVLLLAGSRAILEVPGIEWAAALTGTSANVELLEAEGFDPAALAGAAPNDLVLAARGVSAEDALDIGESVLFDTKAPHAGELHDPASTTLEDSIAAAGGANLALVSVGGAYATLEAQKALSAGLNVMLFSDNVSLEDEIALKTRGEELSLLVMGPGAGTAMISGVGLGFTNAVRRGPVGVVAAAGTGAQEVMTLLHRWGLGISHVIGVGGRDLSDSVGGAMTSIALRTLEADPDTQAILLVSKPPSADVATRVLDRPSVKPIVATLIGLRHRIPTPNHVRLAARLDQGVVEIFDVLGRTAPATDRGTAERVRSALPRLGGERTAIRGLFSGGTLCYEAMTIISGYVPAVFSNTPLREEWRLSNAPASAHVCLDLGEEEYTLNRPHPMIDPEGRIEHIEREGRAPETAVVLIDVVLGFGSHPNTAGMLAPACDAVMSKLSGPQVVAYVLGTDADPQDMAEQRRQLEEAGCIVATTNARAAMAATAIATRRPELSEEMT